MMQMSRRAGLLAAIGVSALAWLAIVATACAADVPRFEVTPSRSQPLPNNLIRAMTVDAKGNVYTVDVHTGARR